LQVLISMNKNTMIAKMIGELDHHTAGKARDKLEQNIINKSARNLIFDFEDLTFMDSSGIGMIIGRFKLISALGGKVNVACCNKQIERIITMSGLKKIINVYRTLDEAIESI